MSNLRYKIIRQLKENEGISAYEIAKNLKKYESNIKYYLKDFERDDVIRKKKSKYFLNKTTFIYNGAIVIHFPSDNSFLILDCRYQGECKCTETFETCKQMKELPKEVRGLINGNKH